MQGGKSLIHAHLQFSEEDHKSYKTKKGPYSVTITLTGDSSEVLNYVTPDKQGLRPLRPRKFDSKTEKLTGRSAFNETAQNCCGYQNVARGTTGFSVKRFLPRETNGDPTNAYLLARPSSLGTTGDWSNQELNTIQRYVLFSIFYVLRPSAAKVALRRVLSFKSYLKEPMNPVFRPHPIQQLTLMFIIAVFFFFFFFFFFFHLGYLSNNKAFFYGLYHDIKIGFYTSFICYIIYKCKNLC